MNPRLTAALFSAALLAALLGAPPAALATVSTTPASLASISAGNTFALVIGTDGQPYGAGDNNHGQLTGSGDRSQLTPLTGLPAGVTARAVSGGYLHTVVIGSDGIPYGAGDNTSHELTGAATSDKAVLTPMTGLPAGVTAVQAHAARTTDSTTVIGSDGIPYVVGGNQNGKLGGSFTTLTPMPGWPAGVHAVDADLTYYASFFVGDNGNVYSAGANGHGQGPGAVGVGSSTLVPLDLPFGVTATAVETSDDNTFIIGSDGKAYGKGSNDNGEIWYGNDIPTFHEVGQDSLGVSKLPVGVSVVAIGAGRFHTVLLGSNGRLYGVGLNNYYQLPNADGSASMYELQELASGLAGDITAVAAGEYFTLITDHEGIVYGSGTNAVGQLAGTAPLYTGLHVLEGQKIGNVTRPTIEGTAQFGSTLTAKAGTWSVHPSEYAYQWRENGSDIPGATHDTYAIPAYLIGNTITVAVTAKRGRLADATAESTSTVPVALGPKPVYASSHLPTVTGTLSSGHTLKISRTSTQLMAAFSPDATSLTYTWYRGSAAIGGAHSSTYKLKSADKGKKIRVRVYGALANHATGSILSATVTIKK